MVASAVAGAASAATGFGLNKIFGGGGGGGGSTGFYKTTPGVNSGALVADPFKVKGSNKRGINVSLGQDYTNALGGFRSLSRNTSNQLGRLQQRVAPGFSEFRDAGLNRLTQNRTRAVGDLRDDLAARRVLGSSFANDAISRAEAEFALQESDFLARTILEEIDATSTFINQQAELLLGAAAQDINAQANLAGISAQLISGVQSNLTALANTNAQIAAQNAAANAQGLGAFFQPAVDAVGSAAGNFASELLSGGGGGD